MIQLSDISFAYDTDAFTLNVPELSIAEGEHVAIVGPSGSGKTTLLNLIAGILVPTSGSVRVDGKDVSAMSDSDRRRFRLANIGMVFQGVELIDYMSVLDNVMLPFRLDKALGKPAERAASCDELLKVVGLDGLGQRRAAQLSVGEQQRVGLCRALVAEPSLVLADEPTSALDEDNATTVLDFMLKMTRDTGKTLVMLTHDKSLLPRFDRVITVDKGVMA
jgi:putative ABC transport system ATP-binding protein